jgi:NAD(P)-dependent dehydrogenase (short-subunit alcohol dehydrogenase family)
MSNSSKIMIVTGGSRGIGAATALLAADRGFDVAVNYASNQAAADAVVKAIQSKGRRAIALKGDVGSEADMLKLFEACDKQLGTLTCLVNNAGVVDVKARIDQMSVARWQRMFNVNVIGSLICSREAVKRMSTKHGGKGGTIVNLSSAAARLGSPGQYVDYAAAKGAIDVLTLGLAREVANEGIRVNAVRPGIIDTEIHASGGEPDRVEQSKGMVPMQRGGTAQEIANAILWLASDESTYTTGAVIDATGGR